MKLFMKISQEFDLNIIPEKESNRSWIMKTPNRKVVNLKGQGKLFLVLLLYQFFEKRVKVSLKRNFLKSNLLVVQPTTSPPTGKD